MEWNDESPWSARGAVALMAMFCLAGCAPQPDFGRYQPDGWTLLTSDQGQSAHALVLTPAEAGLRSVSDGLVEEPHAADVPFLNRIGNHLSETSDTSPSRRYYQRLRAMHPTSLVALVNMMDDDVRIDTVRLAQFVELSEEVSRADSDRAEGLAAAPTARTTIASEIPQAFLGVRARVSENGDVIDTVHEIMMARIVSYRTALAHARLDTAETLELDQVAAAINELDEQLTRLDQVAVRHAEIKQSLLPGLRA